MRSSPIINSLNAGEFSPALEGRTDLAKYPQSCKLIENFLLLVQGPAQRRGGSRYVAPIKNESTGAWLLRFEFSATQAFILEFGELYVRFFTQHGQLLTSGVAAYSGATNYALGDLVLQGGITYYCVLATVLDARARDYEVIVLIDAIRGVDISPGDSDRAMKQMRDAGATFMTTDEAIAIFS